VCRHLDADALVLPRREQVVDHFEALLARRIIRTGYIDEGEELALDVALKERQHIEDVARLDEKGQLAIGHDPILNAAVELFLDIASKVLQSFFTHIVSLALDGAG